MRSLIGCLVAGWMALTAVERASAQDKGPSRARLQTKIPNLTFRDEQGKSRSLYDLKDQKAIVIVFLSFECPVSNGYSPLLVDMAKEYGKHGVSFIGLTVNEDETPAQVAKHAREFALSFPVYKDEKLRAAHALAADFTPEAFVLDGDYRLRYRGRIDDSYAARLKKHQEVKTHDLRQVVGELLSGRPVSRPATQAIGCAIPRQGAKVAATGAVTYHRDVLSILQNHCQSCHRPGEVGPFALMTYKQALNWADDIKSYTQQRLMPPWKPSSGVPFHNERRLSEKDIGTLAAWVDSGTPAGDPKDAPPPRKFPEGWQLGTPDLILTSSGEFTLGPDGRDVFRCFVLPTNLPRDSYVSAVEIRPSNNRIVHHVLLAVDTAGQGRRLEKKAQQDEAAPTPPEKSHAAKNPLDRGPGYSAQMGFGFIPQGAGLTGWAPGAVPRHLPEGSGMLVPKNADVVMQVHYHRNGRLERDRTQVGLYLSKTKVDKPFYGGAVAGREGSGLLGLFFRIPAGAERFKLTGDAWAADDFTLFFVTPHMHMLGKQIGLTMTPPDGPTQTLIHIDAWDYNWQETYMLKEPIHVKKGTKFHVDAIYDNSADNPLNPFNPPRTITFGEQTTNEMCFVFLGGTTQHPRLGRRGLPVSPLAPAKGTAAGK
ncbi:MAG: redoxin domain-containing protein [Gemmataceae bacterium]|nr:redoxin domain-containing protein [Gemmataceae bacterium]